MQDKHSGLFGPVRQWGFVVSDLDGAVRRWTELAGVGPWWIYRDVELECLFRGTHAKLIVDVAMSYQNDVQIELMQQKSDQPSPYNVRTGGEQQQYLHQVGFVVDDVDQAIEVARTSGLQVHAVLSNAFAKVVYLEDPAFADIVIELMPASPEYELMYRDQADQAANWDGKQPIRAGA